MPVVRAAAGAIHSGFRHGRYEPVNGTGTFKGCVHGSVWFVSFFFFTFPFVSGGQPGASPACVRDRAAPQASRRDGAVAELRIAR